MSFNPELQMLKNDLRRRGMVLMHRKEASATWRGFDLPRRDPSRMPARSLHPSSPIQLLRTPRSATTTSITPNLHIAAFPADRLDVLLRLRDDTAAYSSVRVSTPRAPLLRSKTERTRRMPAGGGFHPFNGRISRHFGDSVGLLIS